MKLNKENFFIFLISWLIYHLQIASVLSLEHRNCSLNDPNCEENETCIATDRKSTEGYCACQRSFTLINGKCIPKPEPTTTINPVTAAANINPDPHNVGGTSGTLWILIPCLLLGAAGALILVSRRYKLMERLYALRLRRYNTVFVSSLNDDDAPIT